MSVCTRCSHSRAQHCVPVGLVPIGERGGATIERDAEGLPTRITWRAVGRPERKDVLPQHGDDPKRDGGCLDCACPGWLS